jgi:hypothetical protein
MAYCYKCGVELERGAPACPLCGTPVPDVYDEPETPARPAYPNFVHDPEYGAALNGPERRRIALEILSLALGLAAVASVVIDLADGGLAWSRFVAASIVGVWGICAGVLALWKRPGWATAAAASACLAAMVGIDAAGGWWGWSLAVGLPMVAAVALSAFAVGASVRKSKQRGLNVAGHALIAVAASLCILELTLDLYADGRIFLRWSLITAASIVPVSLLFYYMHARLLRGADLRKFFRL